MRVHVTVTVVLLGMVLGGSLAWAAGGNDCYLGCQGEQACCQNGEGCDSCSLDPGCGRQRCWGIVGGVEATYLKANIRGESAILENDARLDSGSLVAFKDLVGSPRIWLGVEGAGGWGARARYWEYTASRSLDNVQLWEPVDEVFESLHASSRLHVYALDVEATRRIEGCNWSWLLSFGLRNTGLKINHGFDLVEFEGDEQDYDILLGTAHSVRQVDATGLTACLEGKRPFGDLGLSLVGNLRGSMLWGNNQALGTARILLPDADSVRGETTQYIFDAQVGLEWSRRIECLRGSAFAHVMLEYQRWTADDNDVTFDLNTEVGGLSLAMSSIQPNVDFAGIAFGIGFTR